jgi:hypothetical protein
VDINFTGTDLCFPDYWVAVAAADRPQIVVADMHPDMFPVRKYS